MYAVDIFYTNIIERTMLTGKLDEFRGDIGLFEAFDEGFGLCALSRAVKTFNNNECTTTRHDGDLAGSGWSGRRVRKGVNRERAVT